jgi:hypothetical protein
LLPPQTQPAAEDLRRFYEFPRPFCENHDQIDTIRHILSRYSHQKIEMASASNDVTGAFCRNQSVILLELLPASSRSVEFFQATFVDRTEPLGMTLSSTLRRLRSELLNTECNKKITLQFQFDEDLDWRLGSARSIFVGLVDPSIRSPACVYRTSQEFNQPAIIGFQWDSFGRFLKMRLLDGVETAGQEMSDVQFMTLLRLLFGTFKSCHATDLVYFVGYFYEGHADPLELQYL